MPAQHVNIRFTLIFYFCGGDGGAIYRLCRMDYVVMIFCMLSNGKQRYFIKKNKHVSKILYTYKSVVFDSELR